MKTKNKKEIAILIALIVGIAMIGYQDKRLEAVEIPTVNVPKPQPVIEVREVAEETIREVSAYNVGDPAQTDDSPCISANGENICLAVGMGYRRCAANFVPLGTDLVIDHYGQCKVTDRMNSRFKNRVDIAMGPDEKARAIKFGLQHLNVRILTNK